MPENPGYYGIFKEGFVLKDGNFKTFPDYNKFSDTIQKIDQNQRLLYLEWNGSALYLGAQFFCKCIQIKDGSPARPNSRRIYFEQIQFGKNDPRNLNYVLKQFYQNAGTRIKSFYSNRYDNITMTLGKSVDFNDFISNYNPMFSEPRGHDDQNRKNDALGYFAGKILFNEQCTVISSDLINGLKLITHLFTLLKNDKQNIRCIISELDNPIDSKTVCDLLIKIPVQTSSTTQNNQAITFNADNQTFFESVFTQNLYRLLFLHFSGNRSLIQNTSDSEIRINNFVQSISSSKDSIKIPISELCKSQLGRRIATETIFNKINNHEKIDSDVIKLVYKSLKETEQINFTIKILYSNYVFPELYMDIIKRMIFFPNREIFSYFTSKDFPEYRNYYTNISDTFEKLPWDNEKFYTNAIKFLEELFSKYSPDTLGEGGKIFTTILYQDLQDHHKIDADFIQKYSEKMKLFKINIPVIPDKSLLNKTRLFPYFLICIGFAMGVIFSWIFSLLKVKDIFQQLNPINNPDNLIWFVIPIIVIIIGLVFLLYKTIPKRKQIP